MNKFEQLIEFVINDEDEKARELFHDIVVEKSRQIYEDIMTDEEGIEESADEDLGEAVDEEQIDEELGGDPADSLMSDVEAEEQGVSMEGEDEDGDTMDGGDDHHDDVGGDEELEDRVVDLEDKLDELMAEFESLMGGDGMSDDGDMDGDMDVDMDVDMDDGMGDEEVVDDEFETEGMFNENVSLKAVPKPTHGDSGANAKSPVAANSGARGAMAKPVMSKGDGGNGRPAPTAKDAIGRVGNTPAQGTQKPSPATKPHLAQATGVNTKSPLPKQ
jgi:hypothetical protein